VAFFLFGPGVPFISEVPAIKVTALVHEPNLYASLLAAAVPLAAEMFRSSPRLRNAAMLTLLLVALGLGVTRGAYIGLAAGLAVWVGVLLWRRGYARSVGRALVVVLVAGAVGLAATTVLLDQRSDGAGNPGPGGPGGPGGGVTPGEVPNDLATLEYRMKRVELALIEMQRSPLIGMGAFSYGQRHLTSTGEPEVIAVLPVAVLHDSGVIGLTALTAFFVLLARRVWRISRSAMGDPAVALLASVAVLLVSYLATTALHFAVTWLIVGCTLGATLLPRGPVGEGNAEPGLPG
jgi:O-antigen ligase